MPAEDETQSSCPIDPVARAAWLEKAVQAGSSSPHPLPRSSAQPQSEPSKKTRPLSHDREISTIPRADPSPASRTPNPTSHSPANHEQETGAHAPTGNWIYPSEKMFFDAMRRKRYDPRAADVASIVPIHNAVNEKAWAEIRAWEARFPWAARANAACGGPRLYSFSGDSTCTSLRARWNALLGYRKPFDRHDWVVQRCGGAGVEYVIDFYEGRSGGKAGLSFYLDVRPKLNSWEGWKMRMASWVGLW